MIKPIKVTVQESGAITFDVMEKLFEQIKQHAPTAEEVFESRVHDWFLKEYPDVDMNDSDAIKSTIDRDKLEIIRNNDFSFGCVIKNNIPVFTSGKGPSFDIKNRFYEK
jgi:hypothetical protein